MSRESGFGWSVGGGRGILGLLTAMLLLGGAGTGAAAQTLPLEREIPPPPERVLCTPLVGTAEAPSEEDAERAAQLLAEAARAAVLGELEDAADQLREAAELDPTSEEVAFQLAWALEELGQTEQAADEFCRYLALAPNGPESGAAQSRVEALRPPPTDPIPPAARAAFHTGVERYDAGAHDEAIREFSRALVELPRWPVAHYNRGLAYLATDRQRAGLSDLEEYLSLAPSSAANRPIVENRVAELAAVVPQYSATTAFVTGALVPGMGHVYTGRPGIGAAILATAGGLAAAGIFYKEVEVLCRSPVTDGPCPEAEIADRIEERPFLIPGLAAAGVVTLVGAIHAARGARAPRAARASALSFDPVMRPDGLGLRAAFTLNF